MSDWSQESAKNLLDVLMDVIKQSRDLLGQPPLPINRLMAQSEVWMRFCFRIPTHRLPDCYARWVESGPRSGLRPRDLLDAWIEIKQREQARTPPGPVIIDGQITYACRWCDDKGYQTVLTEFGGSGVRGCICETCPPSQRSSTPLCPPDWQRDIRGIWRKTVQPQGEK